MVKQWNNGIEKDQKKKITPTETINTFKLQQMNKVSSLIKWEKQLQLPKKV